MAWDLDSYNDVPSRIAEFRKKYPDGTLQAEIVDCPEGFVAVKAYAYRTPDDPRPGTGLAYEPLPGKTPYTRDSELQNAETSAWGRAIIAVGAADAKKGVASREEVRNRRSESWGEAVPKASESGVSPGEGITGSELSSDAPASDMSSEGGMVPEETSGQRGSPAETPPEDDGPRPVSPKDCKHEMTSPLTPGGKALKEGRLRCLDCGLIIEGAPK